MIENLIKLRVLASITVVFISGCATEAINDAREQNESVESSIAQKRKSFDEIINPSVVVEESLYFGNDSVKIKPQVVLPKVMRQPISIGDGDKINLSDIAEAITLSLGVRVHFTPDAINAISGSAGGGPEVTADASSSGGSGSESENNLLRYNLRLLHEGTLEQLLDTITSRTNLFWKWDGKQVVIYRQESRTYTLKTFAGKTNIEANVQGGVPGSDNDLQNTQSAGVDAKGMNVWEAVQKNVVSMMSPDGKLSVTDATGVITVTDTPLVHKRVEDYIDSRNDTLTKQVMIKVEIFEVSSVREDENGIDWSAVFNDTNTSFTFNSNIFPTTSTPNVSLGLIRPTSKWNGSESFISALQTKNKVSHVTSAEVITLNGQAAPVRIQTEQGYLKESSESLTDGGTTTTRQVPGTTTSGVSMMIVPKIISHDEVMIQFALDISTLEQLVSFSSGDSTIQLPTRNVKNFMQRIMMRSGNMLVMSGYNRVQSSDDYRGILGESLSAAGGKVKGGKDRTSTLILMTPYIIEA